MGNTQANLKEYNEYYDICVVGHISAGKSTIVNHIINGKTKRNELNPVSALSMTKTVVCYQYAKKVVYYKNGNNIPNIFTDIDINSELMTCHRNVCHPKGRPF